MSEIACKLMYYPDLTFYRRKPDSDTPVVRYDDWMLCTPRSKQLVDDKLAFNLDFNDWLKKLNAS